MKLGIPYVTVATALYLDYFGYTPLCCYDWPHETTPEALSRNQEGIVKAARLFYNERTKIYAKEAGFPVTFDQPGVAARIAAKNTGVTVPFAKLTSDTLSMLLGEVLNNSAYRENARHFQDIVRKTNGLSMAADIVERSFGVAKRPVHRYAQAA